MKNIWFWIAIATPVFFLLLIAGIEYQIPWTIPSGEHGDWLGFWGNIVGGSISTILAAGIAYFVTRNENNRVSKKNADIARQQFVITKRFESVVKIDSTIRGTAKKLKILEESLPGVIEKYADSVTSTQVSKLIDQKDKNIKLNSEYFHCLKSAMRNATIIFNELGFSGTDVNVNESKIASLSSEVQRDFETINSFDIGMLDSNEISVSINKYYNESIKYFFEVLNVVNDLVTIYLIRGDDDETISNFEVEDYYLDGVKINLDKKLRSLNNKKKVFKSYEATLDSVLEKIKTYRHRITMGEK